MPDWARYLINQTHRIEHYMSEISADQIHLNNIVAAEVEVLATILAELKAQPAAAALDFTNADGFVATLRAEAAADAPVVAPVAPVVAV